MGRNTVYGQFESIDEVVSLIAKGSTDELLGTMMSVDEASAHTPNDGITTFAQRWVSCVIAVPEHAQIALKFAPDQVAYALERTLSRVVERGVTAGAFAAASRQRVGMLRAASLEAATLALAEPAAASRTAQQLAALLAAACRAP